VSSFRIVEHTADVGLEAEADTLEGAVVALVEGFGELVCPEGEVQAREERTVSVEAPDLDDLVVDLLDQLNYVHQVDRFVPAGGTARIEKTAEGYRVRLQATGEGYDREAHGHLMEIKATTYHGLEVERDPGRVAVLFDV
jgi:SHS2 domain-containing protein